MACAKEVLLPVFTTLAPSPVLATRVVSRQDEEEQKEDDTGGKEEEERESVGCARCQIRIPIPRNLCQVSSYLNLLPTPFPYPPLPKFCLGHGHNNSTHVYKRKLLRKVS